MPTQLPESVSRVEDLAWQVEGLLGMKADVEALLMEYGLPEYEVKGQYLEVAVEKLLKLHGINKPTSGK